MEFYSALTFWFHTFSSFPCTWPVVRAQTGDVILSPCLLRIFGGGTHIRGVVSGNSGIWFVESIVAEWEPLNGVRES